MPRIPFHRQNTATFSCTDCAIESYCQVRVFFSAARVILGVLSLFSFAFPGILSGNEAIRFSNLTTLDGLPQGGALSFEEDGMGFVWFGTADGLRRFDGYEMNSIGSLDQNIANAGGSRLAIRDMVKVGKTKLLVATRTEVKIYNFLQTAAGAQELNGGIVSSSVVLKDPNSDQVYVGTGAGLYRWENDSNDLELVFPIFSITALAWEKDNTSLLLGTNKGQVLSWDLSENGTLVNRWSCASAIKALQPMPNGTLWVGSYDLGLYQLKGFQEVAHFLEHPDARAKIPSNHITSLLKDSQDRLWVGTSRGLALYEAASNRFDVYQQDPSDLRSLGSNEVQCLFEDRRGVMWVGHRAGVSRFGLNETWFTQYRHRANDKLSLGHDAVFGLTTAADDTLWIGTAGGLFAYQDTENSRMRMATHPNLRASFWNVSDLIGEDDGSLWIGTRDQGLQYWQPATSKLARVDTIVSDAITALAQDSAGNMWVGTRDGLAYGSRSEGFKTFHHERSNSGSLHSDVVTALYISPDGLLHVGTDAGGVQVHDPESESFEDLHRELTDIITTVMVVDQQDHLWIGTLGHGVFVYDHQTDDIDRYHINNSDLPDNDIQGLLLSAKGTVWLSTSSGIANNAAPGHFRVFDTDDGLAALNFHPNAYTRDRSGRLYFGGDKGVSEIDIDKLPKDKLAHQPILTGLEINGVKQQPAETNPHLKKPIGLTKRLDLPFDRGTRVGLTFATLDYTVPARNRFRYRMLPLERVWTHAGKERLASYTGLPPGDYQLQVQSSLDGARWNQNDAVMEIKISPPWYLTWWFIVGSVLISVGLVIGLAIRFFKQRHQRSLRHQEVLENGRNKAEAALADELQRTMVLNSATETSDNPNLYKVTLEHLGHYFNGAYGGIFEVIPGKDSLNLISELLTSDASVSGLDSLSRSYLLAQDTLAAGEPLIVSNVATDSRLDSWAAAVLKSGLRALLILPTMNQSQVNGLVIVGAEEPKQWGADDVQLMETVASQIGRSMMHHQLLLTEQQSKFELERARNAAETANQAKSDFLAKMTHELRTPLNSIIGFTQLLEEDQSLAPDHRDTISIINSSGNHLLETVNGILDMSKIEQGQSELNPAPFDLEPFIKEVLIMMRGRAESSGLTLIEERSTSLPTRISTDKVKLRQVLINFIGNSIKFTETGGITLRLKSLGPVSGSDAPAYDHPLRLQFEIIDSGCGIDDHEISGLFESFSQTASGRQSGQGTGLGLPISKNFVELMGGDVRVESKRNHGTIFSFDILCDEVPSVEAKSSENRKIDGIPRLVSGTEPFRILIAEDQLPNRLLLRTLLKKAGFKVIEAENGKQAVEKWRETKPDLIFMDNDMPFMTGLEATRKIIEEASVTEKPSIIFLSAFAIESYRQEALEAGCIDYLTKPFDKQDLFKLIEQHTLATYC